LGRKRNVLLCDHEPRRHKSRNDCSKNKHTADCTVRSGSQVGESSLPECRGTDHVVRLWASLLLRAVGSIEDDTARSHPCLSLFDAF
jgi:hypothetical protein